MKKLYVIVTIAIILGISGYVLFTLKSGGELNEASPLDQVLIPPTPQGANPMIKDSLDTMNKATKEQFLEEVAAMKNKIMEMAEKMPQQAQLLAEGDFNPRFHSVEGKALLTQTGEQKIVRFENFLTDNGPRLHIYLSADLGADDFVDLGEIRATKGNVNYSVPSDTDTKKYHYVLVWCKPFGVLFSYADLQ